jgi:hypothetical protein
VGRQQLGQALFHREEKIRLRRAIAREHLEGVGSIVDVAPEEPPAFQQDEPNLHSELQELLPPEQVDSIKAALNSLELEKSVQSLLDKNQRALKNLEKLQIERLTNHPTSLAEEHSEEWETGSSIPMSLFRSLTPFFDSPSHT